MEASVSVASAVRAVSQPITSSQPSRKEWRIVSDQPVRHSGNEERSKLEQTDERLIYEQVREPLDVDFCSFVMDGSLDDELLQQRLERMVKQREEWQQIEIELRARLISRSEIMDLRNSYEAQLKEQANANVKLQEQLHERKQTICELGRKMEEKDRELHAIRLDNEAAWAKEDLLKEQNKELATIRRERDNSEAERAQHLKQVHDLQEHIQEKERQFLELQEQHRVAQETILFKDEQLREAQTWIARVQEMDALQSSTNHSLQTELRERSEQYNQLWIGCQRQFAEMERLHLHTIQQLQLELADARERNGTYPSESQISQTYSKDVSQLGQSNGNQVEVSQSETSNGNAEGLPNGNVVSPFVSAGNSSTQADLGHGVPVAPSSLLGMPSYFPPGQVTALHPFVMHQQAVPHSVQPNVPQSNVGFFHSEPAISSLQQWQNQQVATEGSQMQAHSQYPHSQTDQKLMKSDGTYEYEVSMNGQNFHREYLDAQISQGLEHDSVVLPSNKDGQTTGSGDKSYLMGMQSQQGLQQISSQFHDALRFDSLEQNSEMKEENVDPLVKQTQGLMEETIDVSNTSPEARVNAINFSEGTMNNVGSTIMPEACVSMSQKNMNVLGMTAETSLLDEQSLFACIARTIPPGPGGRIRISTTLPNRLGKMLAPLTWNDYNKKYGKLNDFVSSHPELFVIEGDYIQLREGAQEFIAATAAVAKVAAAAAVTSSCSSLLPSVAVTPMAQSHRLRKASSIDSNTRKAEKIISKEYVVSRHTNAFDNSSQLSTMPNQDSNGVSFNVPGGFSTIKFLSKPKDQLEMDNTESRPDQSSILTTVGNGSYSDRSNLVSSQSKGLTHGKSGANFVVKKQSGRTSGAATISRR